MAANERSDCKSPCLRNVYVLDLDLTTVLFSIDLAGAAAIWEATIQAEMPKWKIFLEESTRSVAGIPENVLHKSKGTVFGAVSAKLAADADDKLLSISYQTNPAVRDRVRRSMGLDESMEKLFVSSAQVACK